MAVTTQVEMETAMGINNFYKIISCKLSLFIFILILSLPQKAFAQFSFETSFESYYDDNIYNNAIKAEDFVSSFNYGGAYDFESEMNNFQTYYMGNVSYFQKNIFKSSNSHKVGIVNTYLLSIDDNPINIGVNYSWRNNRDDFEVFNFNQFSAYANYRHSFSESDKLILGYVFNRNDYKNFNVFSHNEHKTFLKIIFAFESEASISLNTELDYKNYLLTIQNNPGSNNNSQLILSANLAKSIDENTGIALNGLYRKNLSNGTRYINSGEFIFYEEEIFNDLYSNEGFQTGISVSKYLSQFIFAKLEFIYSNKNYLNIPATDIEGYDLSDFRNDNQLAGGIAFEFDLSKLINRLKLSTNWNYIYNKSNDYYYNYDNQLFSMGFDWGL